MLLASAAVNVLQCKKSPPKETGSHHERKKEGQSTCRNCGFLWPHKNGMCPAKGQTCNNVGNELYCYSLFIKAEQIV